MFFSLRSLPRLLFGISLDEADFAKRGFSEGNTYARQQLELSARTFIQGYSLALEDDRFETLVPRLATIDTALRGFAFEGAAMGLTLLDYFFSWKPRLATFLQGPGANHSYMLHVGAGWTFARLPLAYSRLMPQLDPLLCWLAVDGYGFHQGFFSWQRFIQKKEQPAHLSGYARRAFDQGLGRSLWFVKGADVEQIVSIIRSFQKTRQSDLWSGVGLACAYAGGVDRAAIEALSMASASYYPQLAQGVVFAVNARKKANNPVEHSDMACDAICHLKTDEANHLVETCLHNLPKNDQAYEVWRSRIQAHFVTNRGEQAYQKQSSSLSDNAS